MEDAGDVAFTKETTGGCSTEWHHPLSGCVCDCSWLGWLVRVLCGSGQPQHTAQIMHLLTAKCSLHHPTHLYSITAILTAVRDYVKGADKAAPWSTKSAADLRLLCPAGGCATIDKFDRCVAVGGMGGWG